METIIVYVDDAAYAQPLLQAALQLPQAAKAHWVLVACAPRITHRVSRFASNRAREHWRNKWADKLFQEMQPLLTGRVKQLSTLLARVPLPELLQTLQAEHGCATQVVDLRRPKSIEDTAVPAPVQANKGSLRKLAGTLTGLGALWTVLIGEAMAA